MSLDRNGFTIFEDPADFTPRIELGEGVVAHFGVPYNSGE